MNENEKRRYKGIAGRIRMAMEMRNISLHDLARLTGLHEEKLARFIIRRGEMSGDELNEVARVLNVPARWIISGEGNPEDGYKKVQAPEARFRPAGVPPLGWLMTRLASDSWVRIYDTGGAMSLETMEPIYDAEAVAIRDWCDWERVRLKDVVLIGAVNDPDTVDPVVEVYI